MVVYLELFCYFIIVFNYMVIVLVVFFVLFVLVFLWVMLFISRFSKRFWMTVIVFIEVGGDWRGWGGGSVLLC